MNLKNKNVLVVGYGVTGAAAARFLDYLQAKATVSALQRPEDYSGNFRHQDELEGLDQFDLAVKSPGVPNEIPLLKQLQKIGIKIISEIELASLYIKTPLIGITGTNGKTTVATMLTECLKCADKKVFLGGNIGTPLVEMAKSELEGEKFDFGVVELSSFQLEHIQTFAPKVRLFLNVSPSHSERYHCFEDYRKAKLELLKNHEQADFIIYGDDWGDHSVFKDATHVERTNLSFYKNEMEEQGVKVGSLKLFGKHNLFNLYFVFRVLRSLGVSQEAINKCLETFEGVPLRTQLIYRGEDLLVVNDGKSTNWEATKSAINSLDDEEGEKVLILGGQLRSENDIPPKEIQELILEKVDSLLLFGESPKVFQSLFSSISNSYYKTLEELVNALESDVKRPATILFSPAYPSFDLYKNYIERGEHFTQLIKEKFLKN